VSGFDRRPLDGDPRGLRTHPRTLGSVQLPEVLSFREFRAGLAAALRRVQEPGAEPVFVGSHRRAEAVVMSVDRYRQLVAAAGRHEAVQESLASVRAEGLEPGAEGLARLEAVAEGRMSTTEAREQVLARYRR
jgi:PHD/YefM family antitoxin component YafN of YafNO toxin-antitoxin module